MWMWKFYTHVEVKKEVCEDVDGELRSTEA